MAGHIWFWIWNRLSVARLLCVYLCKFHWNPQLSFLGVIWPIFSGPKTFMFHGFGVEKVLGYIWLFVLEWFFRSRWYLWWYLKCWKSPCESVKKLVRWPLKSSQSAFYIIGHENPTIPRLPNTLGTLGTLEVVGPQKNIYLKHLLRRYLED